MYAPLKRVASRSFWRQYRRLPQSVRKLADKNLQLLKADPAHPSLHLKRAGDEWSVRVGLAYRALGTSSDDTIVWHWIGSHAEYDKLIGKR